MSDSSDEALSIQLEQAPLAELVDAAGRLRDEGHGHHLSYSRKVFIPLTHLCRDVCHYCTFAERPRARQSAYLSPDDVRAIARAGAAAGCTEALFTLGDKPELRYRAARDALNALGHETTIDYLKAMCALVLRETGLLPHANPGVMNHAEIAGLRAVSASQGMMLESLSARLCEPGGVIHQVLARLDLRGDVRQLELHALELEDRLSELAPNGRIPHRLFERAFRQA